MCAMTNVGLRIIRITLIAAVASPDIYLNYHGYSEHNVPIPEVLSPLQSSPRPCWLAGPAVLLKQHAPNNTSCANRDIQLIGA